MVKNYSEGQTVVVLGPNPFESAKPSQAKPSTHNARCVLVGTLHSTFSPRVKSVRAHLNVGVRGI